MNCDRVTYAVIGKLTLTEEKLRAMIGYITDVFSQYGYTINGYVALFRDLPIPHKIKKRVADIAKLPAQYERIVAGSFFSLPRGFGISSQREGVSANFSIKNVFGKSYFHVTFSRLDVKADIDGNKIFSDVAAFFDIVEKKQEILSEKGYAAIDQYLDDGDTLGTDYREHLIINDV